MKKILNLFLGCLLMLTFCVSHVTAAETLENVALSKTVFASDENNSSRPVTNAVDGKTGTHWEGASHTSWLAVDLGGVYEVDSVNVLTYPSGSRYYNYEVWGTLDGVSWTKIGEKADTTKESSSGATYTADNAQYCTVKVQFSYNSANSKVHLKELRVYGTAAEDQRGYENYQFNVAKVELEELLVEYESAYEASEYTEETWAVYETAFNNASELVEKTEGTVAELQSTIDALKQAAEGLVYRVHENPEGTHRLASTNLYAMGDGGINVEGLLKEFYDRYAVDYAGLQEVDRNTTRNPFDTMADLTTDTRFIDYAFNKNISYQGGEYGIGIVSTTEIKETTSGLYTKLSSEEQRGWVRTLLEIDGKQVAFYNTHLSTAQEACISNMAEIIKIMDEDPIEYKILSADFNCNREWMYPFLVNYNLANGKTGVWYGTSGEYSDTPSDLGYGLDNIITSRNIEVVDFKVVDSVGLSDHHFIYIDFKLLDEEVPSTEYLDIEVADAKKLEEADYTEASYAVLKEALAKAEALEENASQETINEALFAVQDGVKNLERIYPLISEGKPVTVDGTISSGTAAKINDGNLYTYLGTAYLTEVILDLEELCKIDEIQVFPYAKAPSYYHYKLYTSVDGVNYEYFGEKTSDEIASLKNGEVFEKEGNTAQYVKLQLTYSSRSTSETGTFSELRVYGAPAQDAEDFKNALQQMVDDYKQINGEDYLPNTYEVLQEALTNAETALGQENLSKEDAQAVCEALLEAYEGLVPAPDKTELLTLIETSEAKDLSSYSERTVNNFQEKLAAAKAVYDNALSTQEDVDTAYTNLSTAVSLLAAPINVAYKMELETTDNTVMVTLDGIYYIDEIIVNTDYADGVSYNYDVYVSEDGETWTKAAEQTGDVAATEAGYTHEIDSTLVVKYIKLESTETLNVTGIKAYGEECNNIALGKPLTFGNSTTGKSPLVINDGNRAYSSYWEAGKWESKPWVVIDLEGLYKLDSVNVINYWRYSTRYYQYNIYVSVDGEEYTLYASKDNTDAPTVYGDTFEADGDVYASHIKIEGTYNSNNNVFHLCEVRAYGEPVEYTGGDPADPKNIAYQKPAFATNNNDTSSNVTDGKLSTQYQGTYIPRHVDVDLEGYYDIDEVIVYMGAGSSYTYAIYGSTDGVNFDRLAVQEDYDASTDKGKTFAIDSEKAYRIIRVNVTGNIAGQKANSIVREIKVHGTLVDSELQDIRTTLDIDSYETWLKENHGVDLSTLKDENGNYDIKATYTNQDTYDEIDGIVSRMLGEEYVDWFSYEIAENSNPDGNEDYYEISMKDGRVHIKGNEGVSITTGLNYYLKYYLNVHISQETTQVTMPEKLVEVTETVYNDTPFEVRYAYNYCTLSYTMPFWGYDEWQRELDWLALQGANLILDLTGTEGMFINYLQKLGYSIEEAKEYVCGQSYKAWWLMGNLEGYGGPVTDQWVIDTVEMARINQRKMTVLGIQPIQQGFMGTLPTDIAEKSTEVLNALGYSDIGDSLVEQGDWGTYERPILLRTDYDGYAYLAEEFYESQEFIYGQTTNYYAGDLAHEGGVIPDDLSKASMAQIILDQMKGYDEEAVWIIQSWGSNPKKDLLDGFGEDNKENHVLILDLNATSDERWSNTTRWGGKEFGGTSWVYCMLDNYGGRPGVHGELETVAERVLEARNTTSYMKGIGITPEGTEANPVTYELFWEMAWRDEAVDLDAWLKDYITRRYGAYSDNIYQAWLLLEETAYGHNYVADGDSTVHKATANSVINLIPKFSPSVGLGIIEIDYDTVLFEQAVELFMKDFDQFKDQETYIYDVVDLQRQLVSNSEYEFFQRVLESYATRDVETFTKYSQKMLDGILLLDEIASYTENELTGRWIGLADKFIEDERTGTYDDYGKDMMNLNAKALISTWGTSYWFTYCHRQYSGILKDFNYPMWEMWLDSLATALETGEYNAPSSAKDFFNIGWKFVLDGLYDEEDEYTSIPNADVDGLKTTYASIQADYGIEDARIEADYADNIAPEGTAYAYSVSGTHTADLANDESYSSYWWSNGKSVPTYVGINFGETRNVYGVKLVFETRYPLGDDIMVFDVESMTSNTEVKETLASGCTNYDEETNSYVYTLFFDEIKEIENLRVNFTENSTTMYPALAEILIYENNGLSTRESSGIVTYDEYIYGFPENVTIEELSTFFVYAEHNSIQFLDENGNALADSALAADVVTVKLLSPAGVELQSYEVEQIQTLIDELQALVDESNAVNREDYSENSYGVLENAVDTAEELLAGSDQTVEALKNSIQEIQNAVAELVDISLLKALVEELEEVDTSLYKEEYLENFNSYLEQAQTALNNPDITQVNADKGLDNARRAKKHLIEKDILNIASRGTAYSTDTYSNTYATKKINDGNFLNTWGSTREYETPYGGITFDESQHVTGLRIYFEDNSYRATEAGFTVEIKESGSEEYTAVLENVTGKVNGYDFEILFDEVLEIEDIRVTITSFSTQQKPLRGIAEILVYGELADYTAVDAALAKVPSDMSNYTDETVQAVNDAVDAVENGLEYTYQSEVDAMAQAIEEAVAALELKEADYTAVEEALAKVPADMSNYTDDTVKAVNDAVAAVTEGKNITEQSEVDAMAQAIEEAVAALELKEADYTAVEEALAKVPADMSNYTDDTVKAVNDAVAAVVEGKKITEQSEVDAWAEAIENAVTALTLKKADYMAVDRALETVPTDLSVYTDETAKAVTDAVAAVTEGENITEQDKVNAWAEAIVTAVQGLKYKDAEYEAVNDAIAKVPEDLTIYTKETVDTLNEAIAAVEEGKKITEQSEVDAWVQDILEAIDGLVIKDADYSKVDAALAKVPTDLTIYTEETVKALTDAVDAVVRDKKITEQSEVDAMAAAIEHALAALEVAAMEDVVRISGTTRYETGYKVADALKEELGVEKFEAVVVATGKNFADALAGSYLAVEKNAPILLTNGKEDNIAALHEYIAANVTEGGKVYILGGEGAVPAEAAAIDGYDVVRLSGKSRYETNLAILAEAGIAGDEIIVATGKTFADSLSASAAKLPILLVKPGEALSAEAKAIAEGMKKFYIIGGEGAVSADIAAELAAYGEVVRVSGKTRYETSVAVANTFFAEVEEAVVANGKNFPDGLCGGPLAAAMNAPLILTTDAKTEAAAAYMADNAVEAGYVLGGTGALADETIVDVFALGSADEIILK